MDECAVTDRCLGGHCVNTEGSFNCLCETGFQPSPESGECVGKVARREWTGLCPMSAHLVHPCLVLSSLGPGTAASRKQKAEHFPQINHPMENAFIDCPLTPDVSKDDKIKTIRILVLAEHAI